MYADRDGHIGYQLPGFVPRVLDQVIVTLGSAIDVELMLTLAGTQEAVLVAADSPIVAIGKTAIASVVSQAQIENLPINGRNFISFSIITPGVTTDRTPQQGASATSGLTFAGQRARSNNITVDGVDNNDQSVGSVRAIFSQEAVREFQVLTNSYSAEFGRASGGVVNIITRSGSNTPAGNAFWYFRDETLNAKEHFEKFDPFGAAITRDKAPYGQQQFGGTLGGPIAGDRTFFFLNYEGFRHSKTNTMVSTVPSDMEAMGDFSMSGATIYNPLSTHPNPGFDPTKPVSPSNPQIIRDPFPGNKIPDNMINPVARRG